MWNLLKDWLGISTAPFRVVRCFLDLSPNFRLYGGASFSFSMLQDVRNIYTRFPDAMHEYCTKAVL